MGERLRTALRSLLHVGQQQGAHRVALRAGVSVLVPLLTVLALGHPGWALYAVFGAFTSLYGRNHVHLSRAAMQASAGAALTGSVVLGVLVGALEFRAWAAVPVAALVAALGAVLAAAQDWHPPGPLFLVFGFGAAALVPHALSDVPVAAATAGLSALFALVVGNVGGLLRREAGHPARSADGRRRPARPSQGRSRPARSADGISRPARPSQERSRPGRLARVRGWEPARYALAVALAGGVATAVGIGHPYWAMVAAVAPLSAVGRTAQLVRAGHRVLGTLLGLLTSAALLAPGFSAVTTVLVVAGLQIVTELLVGRNYGLALLFITPTALLMGQLVQARPVGPLLFDRGVETVIGAGIGVAIILGQPWLRRGTSAVD
ncbi:Fusaric acid resistance protein-like [Micromonospora pallida]|uniref:Fusaric acid resistance protein-like n=1 Tax=Micromonospora pallida TaxID=145854 RepID=A0A1C6RKW3_9ACTN|nr:FUSC family protein [Micromonospora pallida]SCL17799.1 Fusaric acid resistance protein-like [Micromonospora pallida]